MLDEITTYILKASVSWQESVKEILRNQADEEAKTQIQKWFADPWDLTVHVDGLAPGQGQKTKRRPCG